MCVLLLRLSLDLLRPWPFPELPAGRFAVRLITFPGTCGGCCPDPFIGRLWAGALGRVGSEEDDDADMLIVKRREVKILKIDGE